MGGDGSGRHPDVMKSIERQRESSIQFNAPEDELVLPNYSGVKREALKTSSVVITNDDLWVLSGGTTAQGIYNLGLTERVGIGTSKPMAKLHISGGIGTIITGICFNDGNTGIYESANDVLRIALGGTSRWTYTGDVLQGSLTNSCGIKNTISTYAAPNILPNSVNDNTGYAWMSGNLGLVLSGSAKMVILSGGNIGMGLTNPTGALHLSAAGGVFFISGSTGNVGIGTTSPVSLLTLSGAGSGKTLLHVYSGSTAMMFFSGGQFFIPRLYKVDGTTVASDADSLKWEATTGRIYGG